uniref:Uncharacterized protein n=1 Tax=Anguilla anguilla TaxID=7936 RepID=A0A0E9URK6_ANGAN
MLASPSKTIISYFGTIKVLKSVNYVKLVATLVSCDHVHLYILHVAMRYWLDLV